MRFSWPWIFGAALAALLSANVPRATAATFAPASDSYVRDGVHAATSFGTQPALVVKADGAAGYNRRSFLKFDLASISSATTATLRLYGAYDAAGGQATIRCYFVDADSWLEETVTWSNQPATGPLQGSRTVGSTKQYWEWDVTSAVQSELALGHRVISLALLPSAATETFSQFNSKEAGTQPPQLVVTEARPRPTATPTPRPRATATPTPTATPTATPTPATFSLLPGVPILVDPNEGGPIDRAVRDLQRDLKKVLGVDSPVVSLESAVANQPAIVVTCRGASTALYRDPTLLARESHRIGDAGTSAAPRIVLQGADPRGTIYAIYEFADRYLDVPPLWLWASWQASARSALSFTRPVDVRFGSPQVRWRAWFPNDTSLLSPWMNQSTDNFDALFETLLRLKYNTLDVNSIKDYPTANQGLRWARECKARGIAITFTHLAPFGSETGFWSSYWTNVRQQTPPPLRLADQASLDEFWTYHIDLARREGFTEVVQSIALRASGDNGFWVAFEDAPTSDADRARVIGDMLNHQISLLRSVTGDPNPPMRTVFYSEIATYMAAGLLTPPADPDLRWNFCSERRDHFPFTDIRNHAAAAHPNQPLGYYMNLQFYTSGSHLAQGEGPWKVERNIRTAAAQAGGGGLDFVVLNVGNVREHVLEIAAGAELLWNRDTYASDAFLRGFGARYFGASNGTAVSSVVADFYRAYWNQKRPDYPGGFERQYLFHDLRYARAAEDLMAKLEAETFSSDPFGYRGPSFFRIVPGDSGATTALGAVVNGTTASEAALAPVAAACDALWPLVPGAGQPLFDDNLRQQVRFMRHLNVFLRALAQAMAALPNGKAAALPRLQEAKAGLDAAQAALDQRHQGPVFTGWYTSDSKFGVAVLRGRLANLIRQYGGTP